MNRTKEIAALDEILSQLETSSDSSYSTKTVQELKREISEIKKCISLEEPIAAARLSLLLAPTGCLQETAIDNGWGDVFLKVADVLDS